MTYCGKVTSSSFGLLGPKFSNSFACPSAAINPREGGGTQKNFDRDVGVTFLGLKFDNLLFFGGCSK